MGHLSARLLGTAALFTSLAFLPAHAAGADGDQFRAIKLIRANGRDYRTGLSGHRLQCCWIVGVSISPARRSNLGCPLLLRQPYLPHQFSKP